MGVKRSFLRPRVLKNRSQNQDGRGIHKNHAKKFCEFMENDIKSFINSLPNESSHYSQNKMLNILLQNLGAFLIFIKLLLIFILNIKMRSRKKYLKKFSILVILNS